MPGTADGDIAALSVVEEEPTVPLAHKATLGFMLS